MVSGKNNGISLSAFNFYKRIIITVYIISYLEYLKTHLIEYYSVKYKKIFQY